MQPSAMPMIGGGFRSGFQLMQMPLGKKHWSRQRQVLHVLFMFLLLLEWREGELELEE